MVVFILSLFVDGQPNHLGDGSAIHAFGYPHFDDTCPPILAGECGGDNSKRPLCRRKLIIEEKYISSLKALSLFAPLGSSLQNPQVLSLPTVGEVLLQLLAQLPPIEAIGGCVQQVGIRKLLECRSHEKMPRSEAREIFAATHRQVTVNHERLFPEYSFVSPQLLRLKETFNGQVMYSPTSVKPKLRDLQCLQSSELSFFQKYEIDFGQCIGDGSFSICMKCVKHIFDAYKHAQTKGFTMFEVENAKLSQRQRNKNHCHSE